MKLGDLCRGHFAKMVYLLSMFAILTQADVNATCVGIAEAPGSNLEMTVNAIKSAKHSLLVNIYEFSSPEIAAAIQDRIEAGVHVEILEEGQPVGGVSHASRQIQTKLVGAMRKAGSASEDHFYEMTSSNQRSRRFHFNHAKYSVIDEEGIVLGSENYSPTGHPTSDHKGNRGWEIFVYDQPLVKRFKALFSSDADVSQPDLIDLLDTGSKRKNNPSSFLTVEKKHCPSEAPIQAIEVKLITSPDTSLSGLSSLIEGAKVSLDLELLTLDRYWGDHSTLSPLIKLVLAASKRGVRIRVLLNDERVFSHKPIDKLKNFQTVAYLNEMAARGHLKLEARIANLKKMGVTYIHNKGALADDDTTLVSSINWNKNSVVNNREAAVEVISPEVNRHYSELFEKDWDASSTFETE